MQNLNVISGLGEGGGGDMHVLIDEVSDVQTLLRMQSHAAQTYNLGDS